MHRPSVLALCLSVLAGVGVLHLTDNVPDVSRVPLQGATHVDAIVGSSATPTPSPTPNPVTHWCC